MGMRRFALGVVILSALAAAFFAVVSRDPVPRSSDARLERMRVAREARQRRLYEESLVPRLPSPDSGLSHGEAMARFWQGVGLFGDGDFWGAAPHLSAAHEAMATSVWVPEPLPPTRRAGATRLSDTTPSKGTRRAVRMSQ